MPYKDPATHREYMRRWMANRRFEWLSRNGPCVDCGSWTDLEVDHVDPSAKVDHKVWSWSEPRRLAELAKCVVRCQTCHLRKTHAGGENIRNGTSNGRAKLDEASVREIRASTGTVRAVAAQYGISFSQVSAIRRGKRWAYLDSPA